MRCVVGECITLLWYHISPQHATGSTVGCAPETQVAGIGRSTDPNSHQSGTTGYQGRHTNRPLTDGGSNFQFPRMKVTDFNDDINTERRIDRCRCDGYH